MADPKWQDLGGTVAALAADAVRVQELLDDGVAQSRARFTRALAGLPEPARELLLPLAPGGVALTEYSIRCALRLATARSLSLQLVVQPINAGYSYLFATTAAEQSALCIEVRAVPQPAPGRGETADV